MLFFDYVFYQVCRVYIQAKGSSPEATAAIIVALIQCLNIVSVAMLIEILRHEKSILSKTFVVMLFLVFFLLNYMRYVYRDAHGYKAMSERNVYESAPTIKGTLVLLYIIVSIGLAVTLAVYEGSQTW